MALSAEARLTGAVILEVLGGVRSTTDAAKAIGVSSVRYYAIEARAIHGLISACAPRQPGPGGDVDVAREISRLREDRGRLEVETARLRALLRSTQRGLGLPHAQPITKEKPAAGDGKKKPRARRPAVRALTAVRRLLRDSPSTTPAPSGTPSSEPGGG